MIQANELRINNWVKRNDMDGVYTIRSVSDDRLHPIALTEHDNKKNVHYACECTLSELKPVILTPKILTTIGFKQGKVKGITSFSDYPEEKSDYDKNNYTYYWDLKVKDSDVADGFTFSFVKWGKEQEYFTFSHHNIRVKLRYLHQLQNLYYALTSTELNIQI